MYLFGEDFGNSNFLKPDVIFHIIFLRQKEWLVCVSCIFRIVQIISPMHYLFFLSNLCIIILKKTKKECIILPSFAKYN